jgi:hypothetical protein
LLPGEEKVNDQPKYRLLFQAGGILMPISRMHFLFLPKPASINDGFPKP